MAAATRTRVPLATTAQVAVYLGRSPGTLRNWRSAGVGPDYIGEGHGVRYDWADVDRWLKSKTVALSDVPQSRRA